MTTSSLNIEEGKQQSEGDRHRGKGGAGLTSIPVKLLPGGEEGTMRLDAKSIDLDFSKSNYHIPRHRLINVVTEHPTYTFWYISEAKSLFSSSPHVHQLAVTLTAPLDFSQQSLFLPSSFPVRRKVLVVLNPRAGSFSAETEGLKVFSQVLARANIEMDKFETKYSGHAISMGYHFDNNIYEGVAFMSGDGTVQEFLRGVTRRRDSLQVLQHLKIVPIPCGTTNALARGLGISSPLVAAACVLANKVVPLDASYVTNGRGKSILSLCGIGWGVPAEIAEHSEELRRFGRFRYWLLKLRFGCCCPRRHQARARYTSVPWFREEASPLISDAPARSLSEATRRRTALPVSGGSHSETKAFAEKEPLADGGGPNHGLRIQVPRAAQTVPIPDSTPHIFANLEEGSLQFPAGKRTPLEMDVVPPSPARLPFHHHVQKVIEFYDSLDDNQWQKEEANYVAIAGLNLHPDAKYSSATDGFIDGIFARKGSVWKTLGLLGRYLCKRQYSSPLMDYVKLRALEISPIDPDTAVNVDGEVFPGPGPFRSYVLPKLLHAYGVPPEVEPLKDLPR